MSFVTAVRDPLSCPTGLAISIPIRSMKAATLSKGDPFFPHTLCMLPCAPRNETLWPCFQTRSELVIEELQRMMKISDNAERCLPNSDSMSTHKRYPSFCLPEPLSYSTKPIGGASQRSSNKSDGSNP
jgi:hypothetical protein